jgi:hypothetical protein
MGSNAQRLAQLKGQVEALSDRVAHAQGALDNTMEQIRERFGCASLEDAQTLLGQLEGEEAEAQSRFERALHNFERKWGSVLE